MEFKVRCVHQNGSVKSDKFNGAKLRSSKIEPPLTGVISCGYIDYTVNFNEDLRITAAVSSNKIDGKYEIIFIFTNMYGNALSGFIKYLEENHEKNIVELSV